MNDKNILQLSNETLDPENWDNYRELGHQMVNDMIDFLSGVRNQDVWNKPTEESKASLRRDLPKEGSSLDLVYQDFLTDILPYRKGNIHPRFFSWVEGTGTFSGALADMLASVMNSNLGIGDHSAVYVEHQVLSWCKQMLGFSNQSSGLLVNGASMANLIALVVARNTFRDVKKTGLKNADGQLVLYCSAETHNCIFKAAETIGIGSDYLRKITVNDNYQIDLDILERQISDDRRAGLLPFCIVASAGTVNTGAIDPLRQIADICKREQLWFHVDGAIGAVMAMVPEYAQMLEGLTEADSVAFDLHKWLHINYEAGCVLIKDSAAHRNAFAQTASYLVKHERGLAAGPESFSNYGLDLSRGFKSLKIWMSIKEHGADKYKRLIQQNIRQAIYLGDRVTETQYLELLTPVTLNIVCFRYNPGGLGNDELNKLNKEIVMQMQEQGIAAPSYTFLKGSYAIRVCINNHRTRQEDLEIVIEHTLRLGGIIQNNQKEFESRT
jgi:aromatic-L-amino-acid decarboxylase